MVVEDLVRALNLEVKNAGRSGRRITGGYCSDLLSEVMGHATQGNIWFTLQSHPNVVAVASLLDLAAVVITEGHQPSEETLAKARDEGVTILATSLSTFEAAGQLYQLLAK